ncbi:MAG: hypothetical protein ACK2TW_08140 [Anaerolineales bacterium]
MKNKSSIKRVLGELPLTAEAYWLIRQKGQPLSKSFSFSRLEQALPNWCDQALNAASNHPIKNLGGLPKKILVFSTLRYWIEHSALLSLALAGLGHNVTFAYLPYANWWRDLARFDIRRQNAYASKVLGLASPVIQILPLFNYHSSGTGKSAQPGLPEDLTKPIREVSIRDTQYTLQIEDIFNGEVEAEARKLYDLRMERNQQAATALLNWIRESAPEKRPDLVITPNGSILEMGAIFQTARFLEIPTVTYEFGEQRGRIWFDLNREVMLQNTNKMWQSQKNFPFSDVEKNLIRDLYISRQNASLWKNFARLWQEQPGQGGNVTRQNLSLDSRPIALLAANVIGDSLTLGRQVFTRNMSDWLDQIIKLFANRQDVQFIIRVHPGERYTKGPSVAQLARNQLPEIPENFRLIQADSSINTYDLIEIADLGLVYTTTVGLEMAMSGIPVIVAGKTHYRGKGFTLDPYSWENLNAYLEQIISDPNEYKLNREQVENAWHYAYCFFFEYPCPFPWHLRDFWKKIEVWPIEKALSVDGLARFGDTFRYLTGEPRDWNQRQSFETFNKTEDFNVVLGN